MKKTILLSILALLGITQAAAQEDTYLPLVREGVKWVNEKVIINHGDTTTYYYTYEFHGWDSTMTNLSGQINHACYYYTDNELDEECDSLIAGMRNGGYYGYTEATCFRNNPYREAMNNDRLLFPVDGYSDGGTKVLYMFGEYYDNYLGHTDNRIRSYYMSCQYYWAEVMDADTVLTDDNFVMVDPIIIEGINCSRCAYINEQGDTMCYVVEGIGFDSKCMGDLLTPFMIPPDPNADYQEYCGLSHVIKDGKIIYKGMRFNPNAIVLPGDVDGDGEITISDANSVIDIVVMGGNAGHTHSPAADANGDGEVTIADVNAIVNMIMDN